MPPRTEPADKLYQRIMQKHDQTFAAGRQEVAYHLLAAALHAAEELNSVDLLEQLEGLAITRQSEIDETAAAARGRIAADSVVARIRDQNINAD